MIDRTHSEFSKYEKKFWSLVEEEKKEVEKYRASNLLKGEGKDSQTNLIYKKYAIKIKALQNEFFYLFCK